MTNRFEIDHHSSEIPKSPENRYDYSQFGLDQNWVDNDEKISEILNSIKSGDMNIQKATDLYFMINEQADMTTPDENEDASPKEANDSAKLIAIATSIYDAIRLKVPASQPLKRGEFPEVEEV